MAPPKYALEAAATFVPPDFVGEEVSLDARYSGFSIAQGHVHAALQDKGSQSPEAL